MPTPTIPPWWLDPSLPPAAMGGDEPTSAPFPTATPTQTPYPMPPNTVNAGQGLQFVPGASLPAPSPTPIQQGQFDPSAYAGYTATETLGLSDYTPNVAVNFIPSPGGGYWGYDQNWNWVGSFPAPESQPTEMQPVVATAPGSPQAQATPSAGGAPQGSGFNMGGFGQPAGYFGVAPQGPIGAYGVGGQGGSFYGGGIPIAPGASGGAPSPGAISYGLGPLPGTPGEFGGGGGGGLPSSYSAIAGFHSPQFQAWMAQNNINPQEMLASLTGSGSGAAASTSGAYHSGAGPKGIQ